MFTKLSAIAAVLLSLPLAEPAAAAEPAERVVMDYLAAWNIHDVQRATDQLAYNVIYYEPGTGKTLSGRDAARVGLLSNFMNVAPDAIWMLKGDRLLEGNRIAFEWEFSGTNTGMWPGGLAPTGKHVVLHGMSVFEVDGGKIVYQADYYDPAAAMQAFKAM